MVARQGQSARALRQIVLAALEGRPQDLVIDMREVDHLSSQGISMLVGVRARQRAHKRRLTLVFGPGSATEHALSRSGSRAKFATAKRMS